MISLDLRSFTYDDDGAGLADIVLTLDAGERVLVVGASGSGKSTLARLVAGQFDAGQGHRFVGSLTVAGERLGFEGSDSDPRIDPAAWASHVGYIGQRAHAQLSMVCATVAEEIAFGLANRGVPPEQMRELVHRTADRVGLTDLLERDPRRLSGGELQRVCIAAAVVGGPGVLVLDEPFKGLDTAGRRDIEELLDELGRAGTAVLQLEAMVPRDISGRRVLALAGGTVVAGSRDVVELEGHGTGAESINRRVGPPVGPQRTDGPPAVMIRGLTFAYAGAPVLSIAELDIQRGEAVAVVGPNGSGKSTLLQHLNGLLRPTAGTVRIHGQDIQSRSTGSLASTVGYLFQDTDQQLFEYTVLREVSYGPRAAGRSREEAVQLAQKALADVGLAGVMHDHPHDLCFRDRRLVALASMMATGPDLWVLDEPTVGLDLHGRNVLARMIRRHASDGGTLVMATHDEAFAEAVCSRDVRLSAGALVR